MKGLLTSLLRRPLIPFVISQENSLNLAFFIFEDCSFLFREGTTNRALFSSVGHGRGLDSRAPRQLQAWLCIILFYI